MSNYNDRLENEDCTFWLRITHVVMLSGRCQQALILALVWVPCPVPPSSESAIVLRADPWPWMELKTIPQVALTCMLLALQSATSCCATYCILCMHVQ